MKLFVNILFYLFGVGVPILIIFVAILKKKKSNLIKKTALAIIIFIFFYIIKFGTFSLLDKSTYTSSKISNKNLTEKANSNTTTTTTISTTTKTTTTTTTTKITTTTIPPTTKKSNTNNTSELKIIDGILIVNKTYPLPADYVPTDTYSDATGKEYCSTCINKEAYEQYKLMKADATSLGLNIWIQSGYRSYTLQEKLYNNYVKRDGKAAADTYSARPGYSEHQTGLAFDLNSISDDFQYTNEGKWIHNNAYKYGFILRYPKNKENITGYKYESWHLRYVGVDLATKLYNNGDWITLEEYFNLTSSYSD